MGSQHLVIGFKVSPRKADLVAGEHRDVGEGNAGVCDEEDGQVH